MLEMMIKTESSAAAVATIINTKKKSLNRGERKISATTKKGSSK